MKRFKVVTVPMAVLAVSFLALMLAYLPGLSGPFLFDDFGNLDALGAFGPVDNLRTLLYYSTSGNADPTGRPVAMVSFLLDARDWPADPYPFKRTNLILHMINALLLGATISTLQNAMERKQPELAATPIVPWLAAFLWAGHPLFVSTTLYIVQRHAMLAMTFTLLAFIAWNWVLRCVSTGRATSKVIFATLAFLLCVLLALLSKANGGLAPLLIGIAYLACFRPSHHSFERERMDRVALILLGVPSLFIVGYLLYNAWILLPLGELPGREWTLSERLWTQPRVIWSYVGQLLLPRAGGGGIYVDTFQTSQSWWHPATTSISLLALLGSLVLGIAYRHRWPKLSFAWLAFLGGHLLESTSVPLEMVFEHRNYMPAAFLGWPIAHALAKPGVACVARRALTVAVMSALVFLTWQRASLWGNPDILAATSALHDPDSVRSQIFAAQQELSRGDLESARSRVISLQTKHPQSIEVAVAAIGTECAATQALSPLTLGRATRALATARHWNYGLYVWMHRATEAHDLRTCEGFGLDGLRALVSAGEINKQNSVNPELKRDLKHILGLIALADNDPAAAADHFESAISDMPSAEYAMVQAAALGQHGAAHLGLQHLERYQHIYKDEPLPRIRDMQTLHLQILTRDGYYAREFTRLRQQLMSETGGSGADAR